MILISIRFFVDKKSWALPHSLILSLFYLFPSDLFQNKQNEMGIQGLTTFLQEKGHGTSPVDLVAKTQEQKVTLTVDGMGLVHFLRQKIWVTTLATL